MIYDVAYEFREQDVRRFAEGLTLRALLAWAAYFKAREAPASSPTMVRDVESMIALSAHYYG